MYAAITHGMMQQLSGSSLCRFSLGEKADQEPESFCTNILLHPSNDLTSPVTLVLRVITIEEKHAPSYVRSLLHEDDLPLLTFKPKTSTCFDFEQQDCPLPATASKHIGHKLANLFIGRDIALRNDTEGELSLASLSL